MMRKIFVNGVYLIECSRCGARWLYAKAPLRCPCEKSQKRGRR